MTLFKNLLSFAGLTLLLGFAGCSGMTPAGALHSGDASGLEGGEEKPAIASSIDTQNTPMPGGNVAPTPDPTDDDSACAKDHPSIRVRTYVAMTPVCYQPGTGAVGYSFKGHIEDLDEVIGESDRFLRIIDRIPHVTDVATLEFDLQFEDLPLDPDLNFEGKIITMGTNLLSFTIVKGIRNILLPPFGQEVDTQVNMDGRPTCITFEKVDTDTTNLPACAESEAASIIPPHMPPKSLPAINLPH